MTHKQSIARAKEINDMLDESENARNRIEKDYQNALDLWKEKYADIMVKAEEDKRALRRSCPHDDIDYGYGWKSCNVCGSTWNRSM